MLKFCQGYGNQHRDRELSSRVPSTIPRTSYGKRTMKFLRLYKDNDCGLGMVITCGNTSETVLLGAFVESVYPGSPADLNGNISPGDQIISVNGTDVQNDNFLVTVDLIQYSDSPVELVIAKASKSVTDEPSVYKEEIVEKPFIKSKTWIVGDKDFIVAEKNFIVGDENSKDPMPFIEQVETDSSIVGDIPIPRPRKKCVKKEKSFQLLNFHVPDLTLNHSPNNVDKTWDTETDCSIKSRFLMQDNNIPDIIASQMKHVSSESSYPQRSPEMTRQCLQNINVMDENIVLPGEVYHVVLDKKGGSLGLNIYKGIESACTEQRHIYIHSLIPNGAAESDGRIKPGDKLLEVNGVNLHDLSYQEAVLKLRESPQVAHLILEKGNLVQSKNLDDEILENNSKQYSESDLQQSVTENERTLNMQNSNPTIENKSSKYTMYISGVENSENVQRNSSTVTEYSRTFSSLPTSPNPDLTFHNAKEISSAPASYQHSDKKAQNSICENDSQEVVSPKDEFISSPSNAKNQNQNNGAHNFQSSLMSYKSTPNLFDNSDDEDSKNCDVGSLYRNRSTDCLLSTPHFTNPHQVLCDLYQNYAYIRGSSSNIHQIPAVPIRKKKLKKLEDIYNYCNSDNTFLVTIRKSSRGLGLSIYGGRDTSRRDNFSQLIRIRKLYPLQPALECGKLLLGDVILQVNDTNMIGLSNTEALEVLRSAPAEVVLKVFRPHKSFIPSFSMFKNGTLSFFDSSSSSASSSLSRSETNTYNVENGEFEITLTKRGGSLGFTISKKENCENITEGIYVKALVREPAVSDGRIQPGDKILKVNGIVVSDLSHSEAISLIRNAPDSVTLQLFRSEPPLTPGYLEDDCHISKPLRWEAYELLNDRIKNKDTSDECRTPKRKIKRKFDRISNAPSNSSTESDSSSSSIGQEHIIDENQTMCDITEDLSLEGVGLQRNQRPKSLDVLNSSDRKRCPFFTDEESFHRQSSVMCPNVDLKMKNDNMEKNDPSDKGGKNLLKWRGSTLPHSEEADISTDEKCEKLTDAPSNPSDKTQIASESVYDEDRPVPFPRTTSCLNEKQHIFEVDLDRGWHGRLGFSLCDPSPTSPGLSPNSLIAAEVKAVHQGSLADTDGRIKVGDRLIEVNQECLLNKPASEVIDILRKTRGVIKMVFYRLPQRT